MNAPGASVKSFEGLHIFQEARSLVSRIYALTSTGRLSRDRALAEQMRRSAVSVVSNIAEGFERETNAEMIRFLYIAKGSCGELRAQSIIAHDQKFIPSVDHEDVQARCRKVSAGIFALISYLKRARTTRLNS